MIRAKTSIVLACLISVVLSVVAACDAFRNVGAPGADSGTLAPLPAISQGRDNASRLINTAVGNVMFFALLQQDLGDVTQVRCDPLGTGVGNTAWTFAFGTFFTPDFFNVPSEYDIISSVGETEYVLGLRVPVEPFFPLQFSQVEFSLRAVNPCANGHVPFTDYLPTQADFPSNDNFAPNRSLFNLSGGDVALIVAGIDFMGAPASTTSTMNFLGPTGWLVFLRDNAFRSGRFFNIAGATKGGPPAFFDTPGTGDDGFFESVQVDGDSFDANSEPQGNLTPAPDFLVCVGAPAVGREYAYLDLSNVNEVLTPAPGQGGGIFVIRREAFVGTGVVVNPNVPGPAPAPVLIGDLIAPPFSGYNEPAIANIVCPAEDDNSFNGPAGVHEIGWSVFFVHGG